eukprot:SAG31_NODE_789_length_12087_cov_5.727227_6_plen_154_part_00
MHGASKVDILYGACGRVRVCWTCMLLVIHKNHLNPVLCEGNVVIDLSDFHKDPQVVHNKLVVTNDYRNGVGAVRETRPAPLMSETPMRVGGEAPARGEHTAEVLLETGFTAEEIKVRNGQRRWLSRSRVGTLSSGSLQALEKAGAFGDINVSK